MPSPDGTTEVTIKAYRGSTLVGEWSHSFSEPNEECYTEVTPIEPAISQAVCTGTPGEVSTAGYTLTAVTGVNYFVKVNGGSWTAATTGSLQVLSPGDEFEITELEVSVMQNYVGSPQATSLAETGASSFVETLAAFPNEAIASKRNWSVMM